MFNGYFRIVTDALPINTIFRVFKMNYALRQSLNNLNRMGLFLAGTTKNRPVGCTFTDDKPTYNY
jgi:hypothetical protein